MTQLDRINFELQQIVNESEFEMWTNFIHQPNANSHNPNLNAPFA